MLIEKKPCQNCQIQILVNDLLVDSLKPDSDGNGSYDFPFNHTYTLVLSCPGYFRRYIQFDTKIPESQNEAIYSFTFTSDLPKASPNDNIDSCSTFIKVQYDYENDQFAFFDKLEFNNNCKLIDSLLSIASKIELTAKQLALINEAKRNKASIYNSLAQVLLATNNEKKAISYLKTAMSLDSTLFESPYNLGVCSFNTGAKTYNKPNEQDKGTWKKSFLEASAYFEKAAIIKKDDKGTLELLKKTYRILKDSTNYNRINTRILELNKK